MIVYFAGAAGYLDRSRLLTAILVSFAYKEDFNSLVDRLGSQVTHLFVDSGAFTAATKGKAVDLASYAAWVRDVDAACRKAGCAFEYANLDVMGDQDGTRRNQRALERRGLSPMPIVTYGADDRAVSAVVKEYGRIALGGLVPHATRRREIAAWFDRVYHHVYAQWGRTGQMPRLHWFGFVNEWAATRWPVWSADSRAWLYFERRGPYFAHELDMTKNGGWRVTNTAEMTGRLNKVFTGDKIRKARAVERHVSEVWRRRGIVWAK